MKFWNSAVNEQRAVLICRESEAWKGEMTYWSDKDLYFPESGNLL